MIEPTRIRPKLASHEHYDVIIIGAGMSAMAASIRLAMFDKKVLVLEKHIITGGLNSYYKRKKYPFDVGLHALTNFAERKERRKPLIKLLKQLRIKHDELDLIEQKSSSVSFKDCELEFSNDLNLLKSEIEAKFPNDYNNFMRFLEVIENFDEVNLENKYESAKEKMASYIESPLLREMLICPLLIYGSAWEDDMDFSQFVIMFKSIYLEGFSRSRGGVRRIIKLLVDKMIDLGVECSFNNGVSEILHKNGKAYGVITQKDQKITSDLIISSAGLPETYNLCNLELASKPRVGKMSFCEAILILNKKPKDLGVNKTIIFHNDGDHYDYKRPSDFFDPSSAVLCFPNNFEEDDSEGPIARVTMMANYELWKNLKENDPKAYKEKKEEFLNQSLKVLQNYMPSISKENIEFSDTFSPTTVERYTNHMGGCVYGSPDKSRNGKTQLKNLVVCGTDQGFLGIVGSMLSGISMANLYGLMPQSEGNS